MSRLLVALLALSALCAPLYAAPPPKTIGFTGLLTDQSGAPLTGDFNVRLSLYASADPVVTADIWHDDVSIHATRGLFSTSLGVTAANPLPPDLFSNALFVGVKLGEDAEMQPRIALQSVPYALFAQDVADGSVSNSKLASDGASLNKVSDGAMTASSGKIGIGTNTPGATLDVNGNQRLGSGADLLFADKGQIRSMDDNHRILFRRDENKLEMREYGDIILSAGAFNGQETDALVVKGGVGVGIGTASPVETLDVNGTLGVRNGVIQKGGAALTTTTDLGLYSTPSNNWLRLVTNNAPIQFFTNFDAGTAHLPAADTTAMTIAANGSVGIGTSIPGAKLDVRGDITMDNGSIQATGSLEKLRIVRGAVNASGTIAYGSGFTVAKLGTGRYQIDFTPAFASNPTVITSAFVTPGTFPHIANPEATNFTPNSIIVEIWDIQINGFSWGNLADITFNFIAVGPR